MKQAAFSQANEQAAHRVALAIVVLSASLAGLPAQAQVVAAPSTDIIRQREQELEAARAQQRSAAELQERLKADIAALGEDRSKLNQQLIDIASRVRGVETSIADAEARLRPLDIREGQIRSSLESRRGEIAEVLAALQRAGRRAPPALLVRPEDALQSLRTAMLLGAVVPEMRARTDRLVSDLGELIKLRKAIATERDQLAADRSKLALDQTRLASLVEERQRKQSAVEKDMEAERSRAMALSRQVDGLQELIGKMEQDLKSAAAAAASASLKGTPAALNGKPNLGALKDPGRLSPAIAFASAKGLFALPVNGVKISQFRRFRRRRRGGKGYFASDKARRAGHNSVRWVGCVFRTVPELRTTLDPECRWWVSCPDRRDGAHFG